MASTNTPRRRPVIAIDGPSGAGKSTLAAHLARTFDFLNIDTGAMYRALAAKALDGGLDLDREDGLLSLCQSTTITLEPTADGNRVLLDGADVTGRIRDADVTAAASRVSVHLAVRDWMVAQQRVMGQGGGVVMEGRDIGTAVFPDAEVKIFLEASAEVRGNRRFQQVAAKTPAVTEGTVLADMQARDERDRNRKESPLKAAADAVILDSTALTLDEVKMRSEQIVRSYLRAGGEDEAS